MKGKVITISNFKGGVGKTLLSFLLYKNFNNDFGLIQTDYNFLGVYENKDDTFHLPNFEILNKNTEKVKKLLDKKSVIVDTGGYKNDLTNSFVKRSDLLIIPILTSLDDFERTTLFIYYLKELGLFNKDKTLIVINKYKKSKEDIKNILINNFKKHFDIKNIFVMNDYESYEKSLNEDFSIIERHNKNKVLYRKPTEQLNNLYTTIKGMI